MNSPLSKDDFLMPPHNSNCFFLQICLNFPEDPFLSLQSLNFPSLIEGTLSNHPPKKHEFSKLFFRSNSLDPFLASTSILIESHRFLHHFSHLQTKMKWGLLSLIDYLFHYHPNFLSIEVPNLITSVLQILIDLILMEEMEILEGKFSNILKRINNIESTLVRSNKDLQRTESAFCKVKTPQSSRHSQFFKSFEPGPVSPLQNFPLSPDKKPKSGSGSPVASHKPQKNERIIRKFVRLLTTMRYLMLPMIIFMRYRESGLEIQKTNEDKESSFLSDFILNKNKNKKKSKFSHEQTTNVLKKMRFLQENRWLDIDDLIFSEQLVIFCKKQTKNWLSMTQLKEIMKEASAKKQILLTLEQEILVCSICGCKCPAKHLKIHSNLCKESDILKDKLKTSLNSFRNSEIIWLDQSIRKYKNMIPILKQQINRLTNKTKISEVNLQQLIKPPKARRNMNTCPTFNKKVEIMKNNIMIMGHDENKVDIEDIQETFRKFKAVRKSRDLNEIIREKEVLELGWIYLKTLFKLNENIRNYRKMEITFSEESKNFLQNLQTLKGKIDEKTRERALLIHKESQEIFYLFRESFLLQRKLETTTTGSPQKRHQQSLNTSPLPSIPSTEAIKRLIWVRDIAKKRSNTSLEKFLPHARIESEGHTSTHIQSNIVSLSGQQLGHLYSKSKRKTLEDHDLSLNFNQDNDSKQCLDEVSYPGSQEFDSSNFYKSETLSLSNETRSIRDNPVRMEKNNESWFSDKEPKKKQKYEDFVRFFSEQQIDNIRFNIDNKNEDSVTVNDFSFIKLISKGAFGRVWLVKRKITGEYYAMKIINFADKLTNNHLEMLKNESEAFKRLKGDMFVSAIFTFSHENFICFVMEYMYGGDLGALLHKEVYFSENTAKYYIAEIIQAVDALHNIKIIHRDLKPDNVLIDCKGHLKLTDFGLSDLGLLIRKELYNKGLVSPLGKTAFFDDQERSFSILAEEKMFTAERCLTLNEIEIPTFIPKIVINQKSIKLPKLKPKANSTNIVGTPDYMAPEVLNGCGLKDPAVDWWSVGVILFEFLTGVPPFNDETTELIFENIRGHQVPWDQVNIGYEEGCVSPEAQNLINKLLDPDPKKRLGSKGAEEIQKHKFFRGVDWNYLRKKEPQYIPKIDNIWDMGNFEKKKVYDENEKEDPLFGRESNNSLKISEATNMIKSTQSFYLKRSDMLYAENERNFNRFEENKKQIQGDLEQKEFEYRILESYCQEASMIPSIEYSEENFFIKEF